MKTINKFPVLYLSFLYFANTEQEGVNQLATSEIGHNIGEPACCLNGDNEQRERLMAVNVFVICTNHDFSSVRNMR
jgi:hypothetical protein